MKKTTTILIGIAFFISAQTFAGAGCFEDPIYEEDYVGQITSAVFVRDVPCMDGSQKITTLSAGEKVRVVAVTDRTKIIARDGSVIGWIGSNFVKKADVQSGAPSKPDGMDNNHFGSTIGETVATTVASPTPTNTTPKVTSSPNTSSNTTVYIALVEQMADAFIIKLEQKYPGDKNTQIKQIGAVAQLLAVLKVNDTYKPAFTHLAEILTEKQTMLQMQMLLNE